MDYSKQIFDEFKIIMIILLGPKGSLLVFVCEIYFVLLKQNNNDYSEDVKTKPWFVPLVP